jgi:hypothetical protein
LVCQTDLKSKAIPFERTPRKLVMNEVYLPRSLLAVNDLAVIARFDTDAPLLGVVASSQPCAR